MAEARIGQVIDALVAKTSALSGYRRWSDQTLTQQGIGYTTVFDGPEYRLEDDYATGGLLVIGWSGDDPDQLQPAAESNWVGGPIASTVHPRDETTSVACMMIAQQAETVKAARDAAIVGVTAVADLCRADPSLGIDTSATIGGVRTLAWVTAGTLVQYVANGMVAQINFTVTYQTRV